MKDVCFLLCLVTVNCVTPHVQVIVHTKEGSVRGVKSKNGNFVSFLGIPYARVDMNKPFGDSLKVFPFDDVYHAKDDKTLCPQLEDSHFKIVGSLDCLRVNIYVPQKASNISSFPVMVFIHGGAFRRGNSNRYTYGPDFLVRKGVILVTVNYRLGPYGFMSLGRADIPGNAGLRDQLRALEWIKENIAAFGGDENNITVFGEGAGAASVEFLILSHYYKNLFHKAILQSGTILCDWVMSETDIEAPIKLANYLGLNKTTDVDSALNYLYRFDPQDVIRATLAIGYIELFKPVVERKFSTINAMITDKPSNLFKNASVSIPIIIGFNSKEQYGHIGNKDYFEKANEFFKTKINFFFDLSAKEFEDLTKLILYFYVRDMYRSNLDNLLEFDSDFTFIYPSVRDSRYYLKACTQPVYLYVFDYSGKRNYMKNRLFVTKRVTGAVHGDEIGYLFKQKYYKKNVSSNDDLIIRRMTKMWTDFAKIGNPVRKPGTKLLPFTWRHSMTEPLGPPSYALLNGDVQMVRHPFFRRMIFWDHLFRIYRERMKW